MPPCCARRKKVYGGGGGWWVDSNYCMPELVSPLLRSFYFHRILFLELISVTPRLVRLIPVLVRPPSAGTP
eukprot:scaffold4967_cov116-Isochrysis_galbana.AAC.17